MKLGLASLIDTFEVVVALLDFFKLHLLGGLKVWVFGFLGRTV
jgi:hypothetical protein